MQEFNTEKVGDIWERGWALLAWKLGRQEEEPTMTKSIRGAPTAVAVSTERRGGRNNEYKVHNIKHR